ncbi:MAG: NHLP leader peptide family natural product precursor [Planctomycetaceae bacterium]|nr:NHLP leader peptide family natural product precursor [Planctomycetaceae bacterium]
MPKNKDILAQLFVACWKDEALRARFIADPKAVLNERGIPISDKIDIKVVENADDCVHIPLPASPNKSMDITDDELANAAGGYMTDADYKLC